MVIILRVTRANSYAAFYFPRDVIRPRTTEPPSQGKVERDDRSTEVVFFFFLPLSFSSYSSLLLRLRPFPAAASCYSARSSFTLASLRRHSSVFLILAIPYFHVDLFLVCLIFVRAFCPLVFLQSPHFTTISSTVLQGAWTTR